MRHRAACGLLALACNLAPVPGQADDAAPSLRLFFEAASNDENASKAALERLAAAWKPGHAALLVDLARFMRSSRRGASADAGFDAAMRDGESTSGPAFADPTPGIGTFREAEGPGPGNPARARIVKFLERQTGQRFGDDLRQWRRWLWSQQYQPHPEYAAFKSQVYRRVDRGITAFFAVPTTPRVRLDEIDWGGVGVDAIPALDHPIPVPGREAKWLKDKHVVFGVSINGEHRAYPKRILGWHELVRDRLGDVELTLVYCTLCGTAIPYASQVSGRLLTFGTSGLLYRSNKLIFDAQTMSLWSTIDGRPVLGPLTASSFELRAYPIVTTTWREWLALHPDTTVLPIETGFKRDYSEGAAYRGYLATDKLMFEVPKTDERLKNKAEVLTLLLRAAGDRSGPRKPLAIAAEALRSPVLHLGFAGHDLVVLTSADGANRVYDAAGTRFVRLTATADAVFDERGFSWQITEDALVPDGRDEPTRRRLAARRSFWFAWYAQHPDTELVLKPQASPASSGGT